MTPLEVVVLLLRDALFSGLAALGFAILFNVPRRTLPGCVVCGAAGHSLRVVLMQFGLSIESATLIGAALVGFLGVYFSHRQGVPAPIFTVSGAIPMVPGVFAYQAMISIIALASADAQTGGPVLANAMINAIKTALILGAIALGIAAPALLFRRRRPIV